MRPGLRELTVQPARWTPFEDSTPTFVCGNGSFPETVAVKEANRQLLWEQWEGLLSLGARVAGSEEVGPGKDAG